MYKLQDGNLIKAPRVVHRTINNKEYFTTNPTKELLASLGYKTLEEEQKPEINQYQLINTVFKEEETKIIKKYEITDKPVINDPIPEEQDGYELVDYEYITETEVHRGKNLIKLPEPIIEENLEEQIIIEENENLDNINSSEDITENNNSSEEVPENNEEVVESTQNEEDII